MRCSRYCTITSQGNTHALHLRPSNWRNQQGHASVEANREVCSVAPIASYYSNNAGGVLLHYHRSPRYWIRAMDFRQYFKSATRSRSIHHFRDLHFRDKASAKAAGAILNSSLFFFWFISVGNGRNITGADVEQFPMLCRGGQRPQKQES